MNQPREAARLLVVDDEENVRLSLGEVLRQAGHDVVTAASGEEAIELIGHQAFDLVMTDLAMKGVDGLDILTAVRQAAPDTLAIMLTGYASLDSAIEAIRLGAYDYLTKPANIDDMILTIERGLHERRLALELRARNQELDTLHRLAHVGVGRILRSTRDVWKAFQEIGRIVAELLAPQGATAFVGAGDRPRRVLWSADAQLAGLCDDSTILQLAAQVLHSGEPAQAQDEGHAALAVPVGYQDSLSGALVVVAPAGQAWSAEQREAALTIGGQVGTAIANTELYRQVLEEQETLRLMRKEEERRRGEVYAHMTHELKTPLTAILAHADLLAEDCRAGQDKGLAQTVGAIRRNGLYLKSMIENALAVARLSGDGLVCHPAEVWLSEILEEIRETFEPIARHKRIALAVRRDVDLAVLVDRCLIRMALNNLLLNALRFTNQGGQVTLRCGREGRTLRLEVEDSGTGIPEKHLERVFEPHFQSDPSRGGSGLGLAIVRSIAQAHRGTVELRSRLGVGSCFTLRLPEVIVREGRAALAAAGAIQGADAQ